MVAVVSDKRIHLIRGGAVRAHADLPGLSAVALSADGATLAAGTEAGPIVLFSVDGDKLTKRAELAKHTGEVTALAFSPTGAYLGSCDSARQVIAWDLNVQAPLSTSWMAHKAKVTALAWAPSGKVLATGGVDSSIVVWSVDHPAENMTMRLAHEGGVTALAFLSDATVLSAGHVRAAQASARPRG